MKETGLIRRVDDLGRVVIPKEIRRTLRIADGAPLELFLLDDGVVFKKYKPGGLYVDELTALADALGEEPTNYATPLAKELRAFIKKLKKAEQDENDNVGRNM